mmetsp:Transcript_21929/g.37618  ORF Transcript_21929/g.37618 Transcript_21929/m.37618 type:complete len:319 (+) Transcript_21929:211-1167(+)
MTAPTASSPSASLFFPHLFWAALVRSPQCSPVEHAASVKQRRCLALSTGGLALFRFFVRLLPLPYHCECCGHELLSCRAPGIAATAPSRAPQMLAATSAPGARGHLRCPAMVPGTLVPVVVALLFSAANPEGVSDLPPSTRSAAALCNDQRRICTAPVLPIPLPAALPTAVPVFYNKRLRCCRPSDSSAQGSAVCSPCGGVRYLIRQHSGAFVSVAPHESAYTSLEPGQVACATSRSSPRHTWCCCSGHATCADITLHICARGGADRRCCHARTITWPAAECSAVPASKSRVSGPQRLRSFRLVPSRLYLGQLLPTVL